MKTRVLRLKRPEKASKWSSSEDFYFKLLQVKLRENETGLFPLHLSTTSAAHKT